MTIMPGLVPGIFVLKTPHSLTLRSELARVSQPHPEERSVSKDEGSPENTGSSFETPLRGSSG
jgi:hypothetical protein